MFISFESNVFSETTYSIPSFIITKAHAAFLIFKFLSKIPREYTFIELLLF